MKTFRVLAAVAALLGTSVLLTACDKIPGLTPKFGNFGGGQHGPGARSFDPDTTKFAIRWYPVYVSFGPDNDTLLTTLCHVDNDVYCRIAKYSLSKDRWDVYAYDESYLYGWPLFSPDGQWIYYGATKLCEDRRNFCGLPQIFRMRPDGTGVEMFADRSSLANASFSIDGKRLIYWGGLNRVHMLDVATRQDTQLTDKVFSMSSPFSRPFFTADGKHFIFPADFTFWQGETSCVVDPKTIAADPKTGKKDFGPLFGGKRMSGIFMAAIKDAPVTKDNCHKLTPVSTGWSCAMDGQGRLLYAGDLKIEKEKCNPLAMAIRPADPNYKGPPPLTIEEGHRKYPYAMLTEKQLREGEGARIALRRSLDNDSFLRGEGSASFLRRFDTDARAPDEAVFDTGCMSGSISHDGSQLAFLRTDASANNSNAIAVLKQGESLRQVRLILNWPKLDLIPTLPAHR